MRNAAPSLRLATVFVFGVLLLLIATRAGAQESTGAEFTTAQRDDAQQAAEVQQQAQDPEEEPQEDPQAVQQAEEDPVEEDPVEADPATEESGSEPLPTGTAATGSNPDSPSDTPVLITIQAESCTVDEGASVTLADVDGTEAIFTDGERGVEIASTESEVTIEGPTGDYIGNHATFETSDESFDTDGDYTVVTSTGVTCATTSTEVNADEAQYVEEEVEEKEVVINVPDKKRLAKTGGMPLPGTALLALALVGTGYSVLRFAIRRDDF